MNETPFSFVSVSELNSSRQNHIGSYKSQSISMITKYNQLITSFNYFLNQSESSNYLGVKITPLYDIDSMTAKINIINCLINSNGYSQYVYNLKSGNQYYIKIYLSANDIVSISFSMNNMDKYLFSQAIIYETGSNFPSKDMKITTKNLAFNKTNNELTTQMSYSSSIKSSHYIYVEIEPKYDINYLNIYTFSFSFPSIDTGGGNGHGYDYGFDKLKTTDSDSREGATIVLIIIVIIVVIIIVVKKCKNESNVDIGKINPVSPLIDDNSQDQNRLNHQAYQSQF